MPRSNRRWMVITRHRPQLRQMKRQIPLCSVVVVCIPIIIFLLYISANSEDSWSYYWLKWLVIAAGIMLVLGAFVAMYVCFHQYVRERRQREEALFRGGIAGGVRDLRRSWDQQQRDREPEPEEEEEEQHGSGFSPDEPQPHGDPFPPPCVPSGPRARDDVDGDSEEDSINDSSGMAPPPRQPQQHRDNLIPQIPPSSGDPPKTHAFPPPSPATEVSMPGDHEMTMPDYHQNDHADQVNISMDEHYGLPAPIVEPSNEAWYLRYFANLYNMTDRAVDKIIEVFPVLNINPPAQHIA